MYLLDSCTLITAKRDYYEFDRFPEFWEWLVYMGERGDIKISRSAWDEMKENEDDLAEWLKNNKEALFLDDNDCFGELANVMSAYGNVDEVGLEHMGADPYIIACAKFYSATIVTKENSKPSIVGAKRKLPDVCNEPDLNVAVIDDYQMIRELDFRTNWKYFI